MNVEAESLHLLQEHIEGFGRAGFQVLHAFHDGLVCLGAPRDVVALYRQEFLEYVCRTVCLQRPYLHFTEPLPAELRLSAERLLGHERIWTDGPGVYLVVNKMSQLHNIDVTDGDPLVEPPAGAPIIERGFSIFGEAGLCQKGLYFLFARPAENGRGHFHSQLFGRPSEVALKYLAHVHSRGNPQWIQYYLHRRAVGQKWHILFGKYFGHNALVAMPSGHFVTYRELALGGDIDLYHLDDTGRKFISLLEQFKRDFFVGQQPVFAFLRPHDEPLQSGLGVSVGDSELEQMRIIGHLEIFGTN